jgi:hypothetical protein
VSLPNHPFDLLDHQFTVLCSGPRPVCLSGDTLGGRYRGRAVSLMEVQQTLLRGIDYDTRDRVLAELVCRAWTGEPWMTGVVGVLLPGLRAVIGPLTRARPNWWDDLEAQALAGVLEALPRVRLDRGHTAASLIWAARRSADRLLAAEVRHTEMQVPVDRTARDKPVERLRSSLDDPDGCDLDGGGEGRTGELGAQRALSHDPGNPETVLNQALAEGVLTPAEVEVIAATRLARVPARTYAASLGCGLGSVRLKRYRAEQRLVAWLEQL